MPYDAMIKPKQLADGRWECQNCLGKFTSHRRTPENRKGWTTEPKFCSDNCRKEFHASGAMSYRKLKDMVRRIVSEMLTERGISA